MCYTTIRVHAEQLAAILAQKKIEKKYEAMGFSPYIITTDEYVRARYTEDAEKDYERHYEYFMEVILSKELNKKEKENENIEQH